MAAIRRLNIAILWLTAFSAEAWAEGAVRDPVVLYGPQLAFEIFRDDEPVGEHLVTFQRSGAAITAESVSTIRIPFLIFEAYRFNYRARSTWLDGRLLHIHAQTDDNGAVSTVKAQRDGAALDVTSPAGRRETDADLVPTEHWLMAMVRSDRVLNTITGAQNFISVEARGADRITTLGGKMIDAERFTYRGDLALDSWYDAAGRWVQLRFQAKDGSMIEYRCKSCGVPATGAAANP